MEQRLPRSRGLQLLRSFGAADRREDALLRKIEAGVLVDRRSEVEMEPWLDCALRDDAGPRSPRSPEEAAEATSLRLMGPPAAGYGALHGTELSERVSVLEDLGSPRPPPRTSWVPRLVLALLAAVVLTALVALALRLNGHRPGPGLR